VAWDNSATPRDVGIGVAGSVIGTFSPTGLAVTGALSATGNITGTGAYVKFGTSAAGYIRCDSGTTMHFQHGGGGYKFRDSFNGSDLLTLDASGNLGLGVDAECVE
jgi:hypothetical protein